MHVGQSKCEDAVFCVHGNVATVCACFIRQVFACPEYEWTSSNLASCSLTSFVAHAIFRTKASHSVTFAALALLQRLKVRIPVLRGVSGHRLFITSFMIAWKIICDKTYSNKSWCVVAQGMFSLREINRMEREMCCYLEWQLNVDYTTLKRFECMVRRDFRCNRGPFPVYGFADVFPCDGKAGWISSSVLAYDVSSSTHSSPDGPSSNCVGVGDPEGVDLSLMLPECCEEEMHGMPSVGSETYTCVAPSTW